MAKSGGGVLEEAAAPCLYQLGDLGQRCKLHQRGPGHAEPRPLKGFVAFYRRQTATPGTCWGQVRGEGVAPRGPRPVNPPTLTIRCAADTLCRPR